MDPLPPSSPMAGFSVHNLETATAAPPRQPGQALLFVSTVRLRVVESVTEPNNQKQFFSQPLGEECFRLRAFGRSGSGPSPPLGVRGANVRVPVRVVEAYVLEQNTCTGRVGSPLTNHQARNRYLRPATGPEVRVVLRCVGKVARGAMRPRAALDGGKSQCQTNQPVGYHLRQCVWD